MNRRHTKHGVRLLLFTGALAFAPALAAQQPPRQTPQNVPTLRNPDMQTRSLEIEAARKKDPQLLMAEVNEDFNRLRTLGEEINRATSSEELDPKFVTDAATEVKKRSARLKANLIALPEADKDDKNRKSKQFDDKQLKESLSVLNGLIRSFVTNPIFKDTGAVDPQLAARASRDLDDMLALSEKIRKAAGKIKKTAANT